MVWEEGENRVFIADDSPFSAASAAAGAATTSASPDLMVLNDGMFRVCPLVLGSFAGHGFVDHFVCFVCLSVLCVCLFVCSVPALGHSVLARCWRGDPDLLAAHQGM